MAQHQNILAHAALETRPQALKTWLLVDGTNTSVQSKGLCCPHTPDGELLVHVPARRHRRNLCEQVWRARGKGKEGDACHIGRHAHFVGQELPIRGDGQREEK